MKIIITVFLGMLVSAWFVTLLYIAWMAATKGVG
jgi:hypothetical protein